MDRLRIHCTFPEREKRVAIECAKVEEVLLNPDRTEINDGNECNGMSMDGDSV